MNGWGLVAVGVTVFIASVGGAVHLGIWLGRLSTSTGRAHRRLDRLEENIARQFSELRSTLESVLRDAWKSCPAAGVAHELKAIAEIQKGKEGP